MRGRVTITAYGKPGDADRLDELAAKRRKSKSQVVIDLIREAHRKECLDGKEEIHT